MEGHGLLLNAFYFLAAAVAVVPFARRGGLGSVLGYLAAGVIIGPYVLGLVATSFALNASKIPFSAPIASVRVGRVQGKWVLNPTFQQLEFSDMDLVVAGSQDSIVMVEGGALEIQEEDVVEALGIAQRARLLVDVPHDGHTVSTASPPGRPKAKQPPRGAANHTPWGAWGHVSFSWR